MGDSHDHGSCAHTHETGDDPVIRDPVCGMTVDVSKGKPSAEHDGHSYHFCSRSCHDRFVAEPEKYLTARDPVCGMSVDRSTARFFENHEGGKYYFCSKGCHDRFMADPDAYLGEAEPAKPMPKGTRYTCPMHPEIVRDEPGSCPKCGMALEPMGVPAGRRRGPIPSSSTSPGASGSRRPVRCRCWSSRWGRWSVSTCARGSARRSPSGWNSCSPPPSCCGRRSRSSSAPGNRSSTAARTCGR